jgi:hypothetical protein
MKILWITGLPPFPEKIINQIYNVRRIYLSTAIGIPHLLWDSYLNVFHRQQRLARACLKPAPLSILTLSKPSRFSNLTSFSEKLRVKVVWDAPTHGTGNSKMAPRRAKSENFSEGLGIPLLLYD